MCHLCAKKLESNFDKAVIDTILHEYISNSDWNELHVSHASLMYNIAYKKAIPFGTPKYDCLHTSLANWKCAMFLTLFIFFVLIYSANDTIYNMQFYEAFQIITIYIWLWISDEVIDLTYMFNMKSVKHITIFFCLWRWQIRYLACSYALIFQQVTYNLSYFEHVIYLWSNLLSSVYNR